MTTDGSRLARVADHIQRELTDVICTQMRDPRIGMLSVNEVKVSRDLSYADVYVSMLEASSDVQRKELLAVLDNASGYLRTVIAARSAMRTTPKLRFHYDETLERGANLERLIETAVAEDHARHREQGCEDTHESEGEE